MTDLSHGRLYEMLDVSSYHLLGIIGFVFGHLYDMIVISLSH